MRPCLLAQSGHAGALKTAKMVYILAYIGVVEKVIAFVITYVCYSNRDLSKIDIR